MRCSVIVLAVAACSPASPAAEPRELAPPVVVADPVTSAASAAPPAPAPAPTVAEEVLAAYAALDPACKGTGFQLDAALNDGRCLVVDAHADAEGGFDGGPALKLSVRLAQPAVKQRESVAVTVTLSNPSDGPVLVDLDTGCVEEALEVSVIDAAGERIDLVEDEPTASLCARAWHRLGLAPRGSATATLSLEAVQRKLTFVPTGETVDSPGGAVGMAGTLERPVVGPLPAGEHVVRVTLPRRPKGERPEASTKLLVVP